MSEIKTSNKKGFHYGWVIVFVGFLIMWFVACIFSSAAGMMVKPVSEDLGISRSQFSLGTTFNSIAGMLMATVIGKLYKRFTVKKVMFISSIVFALCYAGMGISPNIYVFYVFSFISGFALLATANVGVGTLLAKWFDEKRGLAMALASTGSGVGGVIMNPVIGSLVTSVGWRQTYVILGGMIAVVLVPAVLFLVKETPADMGLEPYGANKNSTEGKVTYEETGMMAAEAVRSPMFFLWMPIVVSIYAICNCVMQHTVAYATDLGFEYSVAAGIASVLTAGLAIGKLIMGQRFDSMGSRKAGNLSLIIYTVCLAVYFLATKEMGMLMYIGPAIFGFGGSFATVAFTVIVQDIFGKRDYANIFGYVSMGSSLGGALGPTVMAAAFDAMGTYKPAWLVCAVIMFINVILLNMMFKAKDKYEKQ
ncbi:MAG: MFS transporter [Oscillospiraceae bacterium]|nr:MFS transporter [Oscillospiraceae bacterium]